MQQPKQTPLFVEEFSCAYFDDGRQAAVEYLVTDPDAMQSFHEYLATGHRRLGRTFYRNVCRGCSDCVPIRMPVDAFRPSRSQKRALRINSDVQVVVRPPGELNPERIALFRKYLIVKHDKGKKEPEPDYEFQLGIIHFGYAQTIEMDYYLEGRLIGVGIVDSAKDALSANYFYYDTDFPKRRLGVFSILQEIALAQALGKHYYYLGFLIKENPKMSYKKDFHPHETLHDGTWSDGM